MIILAAFLIGFVVGWLRARRRGGTTADRIQYALAHAIPAALLGLIFVIVGVRYGSGP